MPISRPNRIARLIPQAAAIPFHLAPDGQTQILLIRRIPDCDWGIPKGLIDPGHTAQDAARIEAFEEAGVEGELSDEPVGTYRYPKFGGICEVAVFHLKVTIVHERFPEQRVRERQWFPVDLAATLAYRQPVKWMIAELACRV